MIESGIFLNAARNRPLPVDADLDAPGEFTPLETIRFAPGQTERELIVQLATPERGVSEAVIGWLVAGRLAPALRVPQVGGEVQLAVRRAWLQERLGEAHRTQIAIYVEDQARREFVINLAVTLTTRICPPPRIAWDWRSSIYLGGKLEQQIVIGGVQLEANPEMLRYRGDPQRMVISAQAAVLDESCELSLVGIQPTASGAEPAAGLLHVGKTIVAPVIAGDESNSVFEIDPPALGSGPQGFNLVIDRRRLQKILAGRNAAGARSVTAKLTVAYQLSLKDSRSGPREIRSIPVELDLTERLGARWREESAVASFPPAPGEIPAFRQPLIARPRKTPAGSKTVVPGRQILRLDYLGSQDRTGVEISWGLVDPSSGWKGRTKTRILAFDHRSGACELALELEDLIEEARTFDPRAQEWRCLLVSRLQPPGGPTEDSAIVLPVVFEQPADWSLCVDVGTSATAIWCGLLTQGAEHSPLPLGEWLEQVDRTHDESRQVNGSDAGALIPSNIGLASSMNFRDRFDVLSLGDPANAGELETSVLNRLRALGRVHDISVPFPSTSEMSVYADQIVFAPKRHLIENTNPALGAPVYKRVGDKLEQVMEVDTLDLFSDYFDEISSYLLPRVLHWAAQRPRRDIFKAILSKWLDGGDRLQLIVTHPSGLSDEKRRTYARASESFVRRIQNGLKLGDAPQPVGAGVRTFLVSESLAAARFGLSQLLAQHVLANGEQDLVVLDIGAGTFDVTVLTAAIKHGDLEDWSIHSHFGLSIGGIDLDRAMLRRVVDILRGAEGAVRAVARDLPTCMEDLASTVDAGDRQIGVRMIQEFRKAKARLTSTLLDAVQGGALDRYGWTGARAPALSIKVGEIIGAFSDPQWPVQVDPDSRNLIDIGHRHASISVRVPPRGAAGEAIDKREVWLDIAPEALGLEASETDRLAGILKLLTTEIPAIAGKAAEKHGRSGRPTRWIVTGRTALWPPIYEGIARMAVEIFGGEIAEKPFTASEMKTAVVFGARRLASEPHLDIGDKIFNTLALARVQMTEERQGFGYREVAKLTHLSYLGMPGVVSGQSRMALVRAIPCLDETLPGDPRPLFRRLEDIPERPQYWTQIEQLDQLAASTVTMGAVETVGGRAHVPLRIGDDERILSLDEGTFYASR
ncbi:MAG: hypothetical protein U1E19_10765 [Rhodoblastus sp.]